MGKARIKLFEVSSPALGIAKALGKNGLFVGAKSMAIAVTALEGTGIGITSIREVGEVIIVLDKEDIQSCSK